MDKDEAYMMSAIASDFVTGNHLLGRPRDRKQMETMHEISVAFEKICNSESLSSREKDLLEKLSEQFHDGAEDMCVQLGVDFCKYSKAVLIK